MKSFIVFHINIILQTCEFRKLKTMKKNEKSSENPHFFISVRNYFREYCRCTSIHGFRYFGENRTIFERIWWILVLGATLVICTITIKEVYKKWEESPVIVSFATKESPIYSIPFPAVTICPETKSNQTKYSHTEMIRKLANNENLTENERNLFDHMSSICDPSYYLGDFFGEGEEYFEDFFDIIEKVGMNDEIHLAECFFMNRYEQCDSVFKPIITDEGICFTFNIMDRTEIFRENVQHYSNFHEMDQLTYKNWSIEHGYSDSTDMDAYPRRALLTGATNSLTILLVTTTQDIDYSCKDSLQGFRVSLHLPSRIPSMSQDYFRVPLNEVVLATVNPVMMTTSKTVENYPPKRRGCYLSTERSLRFFKTYTNKNCLLECLTNQTLVYCGCVAFFMPRDNSTHICGSRKFICMKNAEKEYQLRDIIRKMSRKEMFAPNVTLPDCDCLPMCSDLSYNVDTSQSSWNFWETLRAEIKNKSLPVAANNYHVSRVTIFFKNTHFISSQRQEVYGPTDFLANFGGLLGLFTGVSIISLMELIYFMTIRICCNSRLYGYWVGPNN